MTRIKIQITNASAGKQNICIAIGKNDYNPLDRSASEASVAITLLCECGNGKRYKVITSSGAAIVN